MILQVAKALLLGAVHDEFQILQCGLPQDIPTVGWILYTKKTQAITWLVISNMLFFLIIYIYMG